MKGKRAGENTLNFGMMDASQLPSSISAPQEASHYDELSMKQSFNFSDSLKDMKHLRKQLYSAADYFELSYNRHDQKQIVVNTLKDYVTRAFINTVDHLGFMTYKVNCLLDDKIEEASAIELRFSCSTVSKAKDGGDSKNLRYCMINGVNGETLADIYSRNIETPVSFARRLHLATQFPQSPPAGTFKFTSTSSNKKAEKRASPFQFQLTRLGSLVDKTASPNPSNPKRQYPSEARRSASMSTHVERNRRSGIELHSSKNKHLFKALLSMWKPRKDSKSYKFSDGN